MNNTTEKTLFTFWEGPQLSLLNMLSIISLARLNPETKVIIYTLEGDLDINAGWKSGEHALGIDHFYRLQDLASEPNIVIQKVDLAGIQNLDSVVQVADYIRIQKLYEHGGIWVDTDVLFCKKIPAYLWDIVLGDGFVISYQNTITTGFIGLPKNSYIANLAITKANLKIKDNQYKKSYQAFGPDLWQGIFLEVPSDVSGIRFLSEKLVYPILWDKLDQFFFRENEAINYGETIGVHWYGGCNYSRSFTNCNLLFDIKKKRPLTNFQKMVHHLDKEIGLLTALPVPIHV